MERMATGSAACVCAPLSRRPSMPTQAMASAAQLIAGTKRRMDALRGVVFSLAAVKMRRFIISSACSPESISSAMGASCSSLFMSFTGCFLL